MNLINNKLFSVFVLLAVFNIVDACQEQAKMTPQEMLFKGVRKNNYDLVQQAIKEGADIDAKSSSGDTALICAVEYNKIEMIKLLLAKGANIDIEDEQGTTALRRAVDYKMIEITRLLLDANADLTIKNKYGNAPLDWLTFDGGFCHRIEIIKHEPERRRQLKEKVQKEVVKHLPNVLADLVSEYVVSCPK